jgi:hypothetical protein
MIIVFFVRCRPIDAPRPALISTRPTERRPAAGCEAERVAGVALPFYNGNIKSAHGDVVGKARLSNACMCTVQA